MSSDATFYFLLQQSIEGAIYDRQGIGQPSETTERVFAAKFHTNCQVELFMHALILANLFDLRQASSYTQLH